MNEPLCKTLAELSEYISTYLPFATIGEDNDGQLVIYTNLYEKDDFSLANYEDPDDEGFWMDQDHRSLPL